jgi:hypothetical protein
MSYNQREQKAIGKVVAKYPHLIAGEIGSRIKWIRPSTYRFTLTYLRRQGLIRYVAPAKRSYNRYVITAKGKRWVESL